MPRIFMETLRITTTGGVGVATGEATSKLILDAFLLDVYLNYHASAPATTDVTISHINPTLGDLCVISNSATDRLVAPRKVPQDLAGADIAGFGIEYGIKGQIKIALAQCDALTNALVATLRFRTP